MGASARIAGVDRQRFIIRVKKAENSAIFPEEIPSG
jgi:hypothetical protein